MPPCVGTKALDFLVRDVDFMRSPQQATYPTREPIQFNLKLTVDFCVALQWLFYHLATEEWASSLATSANSAGLALVYPHDHRGSQYDIAAEKDIRNRCTE